MFHLKYAKKNIKETTKQRKRSNTWSGVRTHADNTSIGTEGGSKQFPALKFSKI